MEKHTQEKTLTDHQGLAPEYNNCLIICYNRPKSAKKVIKAAMSCSNLYLFCDGPKENDPKGESIQKAFKETFDQTQKIREESDKTKKTFIYFSNNNLGQRDGPIQAIDWFLKKSKGGCILEEDIIPSKEFLPFYTKCLKIFENNQKIQLISACPAGTKGLDIKKGDKHAIRQSELFLPWGWAVWQNRWDQWQMTNTDHLSSIVDTKDKRENIAKRFYTLPTKSYFKKELLKLHKNPHYAWSYYIQAQLKSNKGISIMPKTNMTTNVGFDKNATRTKEIQDTTCKPQQTKTLLQILENNGSIEPFNLTAEKEMETLKYGNIIKLIRSKLGVRTKLKRLLEKMSWITPDTTDTTDTP